MNLLDKINRLKFRAFNKITKEFLINVSRIGDYSKRENDDGKYFSFQTPYSLFCVQEKADWEIMQYIGITDSNKKEIFEGDILKNIYKSSEDNKTLFDYTYVEYDPFFAGYVMKRNKENDITFFDSINWDKEKLEVVGNIYQNPELFEKIKNS